MLAVRCATIVIVSQGNKLKLHKVSRRRIVWELGLEHIKPTATICISDQYHTGWRLLLALSHTQIEATEKMKNVLDPSSNCDFLLNSFPQMGHWNSVLCSRLNLDTILWLHIQLCDKLWAAPLWRNKMQCKIIFNFIRNFIMISHQDLPCQLSTNASK